MSAGELVEDVAIDLPELVVTLDFDGVEMELSYDLEEVMELEGDAELLEVTETGVVVEADGETEHIDLRPLLEEEL